jgi:exodeoxyribonuclease X
MALIRLIDFETTGVAPPADVIEVGYVDVEAPGPGGELGAVMGSCHTWWLCGSDKLSAETRAIHHIAPSDIAGRPPWRARDFTSRAAADGVDYFAAHHANFEAQWFDGAGAPPWICTYKCALRVWPDAPNHQNQFLRYWLEEQGLTAPEAALCQPAHRAGPDAYASAHLLAAILRTGPTIDELVAWTSEPALLPRITIGPQRGAKWSEVEQGFLAWMLKQPTMDGDLRWNAHWELERRRGAR